MQKAIIVNNYNISSGEHTELNSYLDNGWRFVASCPMPASHPGASALGAQSTPPTCLVIIEKLMSWQGGGKLVISDAEIERTCAAFDASYALLPTKEKFTLRSAARKWRRAWHKALNGS